MTFRLLSLFLFLTQINSCVSVGVEEPKTVRAQNMKYSPPKGFNKIEASHVDVAWRKDSTGSTISLLSECELNSDSSLSQLQTSLLRDLKNSKRISEKELDYNQRKASRTYIKGNVDGVDIEMDFLVFKKNNCNFFLTYIGMPEHFKNDQNEFQNFIDRFQVP